MHFVQGTNYELNNTYLYAIWHKILTVENFDKSGSGNFYK